MSNESQSNAEKFKAELEKKIKDLIHEFADGKISREQFHVLYERYSARMQIATHALLSGNADAVSIAQTGPPTIAVRDALMGKVTGMLIYHNASETVLDTLGDFDIALGILKPTLEDMTLAMLSRQMIDPRMEKISDSRWLLFIARTYTTVVTHFKHEPSQMQIREIERLLHDFETANQAALVEQNVNVEALAYPFFVFIKQKFKK